MRNTAKSSNLSVSGLVELTPGEAARTNGGLGPILAGLIVAGVVEGAKWGIGKLNHRKHRSCR